MFCTIDGDVRIWPAFVKHKFEVAGIILHGVTSAHYGSAEHLM